MQTFHTLIRFALSCAMTIVCFHATYCVTAPAPNLPETYYAGLEREEIFRRANEYYRNGDFQKALEGFKYLERLGIDNGYLYFNLGNSYYQLGNVGKAMVWYERALRYLPRYDDLIYNYQYARQNLTDEEFRAADYTGAIGLLHDLHNSVTLRENVWMTVICLWGFGMFAALRWITRNARLQSTLRFPCWIVGIAFIMLLLSTCVKSYRYEFIDEAIVTQTAVEIRTGPDNSFSANFTLHEGTKVRVAQRQSEWARIVLPGNETYTGWAPVNALELI